MITRSRLFLLLLGILPGFLTAAEKNCGCTCCKGSEICCCQPADPAAAAAENVKSHPLRGVIVAVNAEHGQLTVKHEAIPGVMRAMTMVFKVDAATAQTMRAGQAITARMARIEGEWWLQEVKVAAPQEGSPK